MKNIVGVGVILKTPDNTCLFQKRDADARLEPGMTALFGGGRNDDEDTIETAIRELREEISLVCEPVDLQSVGIFDSVLHVDSAIEIFVTKLTGAEELILHEGESIVEMTIEEALANENVTDFTKKVLSDYLLMCV